MSILYNQGMMDGDLQKLGYKISYLRKQKGLSQLDLSLQTGLTTRTISRIECGDVDPKYLTLVKIAKGLNITLTDLLTFSL